MSRRTKATREERAAHKAYVRDFEKWKATWTPAELAAAVDGGYDKPEPLEVGYGRPEADESDEDGGCSAYEKASNDAAVSEFKSDPDYRKPIVDFESVTFEELDALTSHFGRALEWASRAKPNLLVMGARMLTIINVMYPGVAGGKRLPARAMKQREFELRGVLLEGDPLVTGDFFRRPLAWVSDSTSLEQLGQRGYSMIMNMRPELVDGMTCAELGAFKNDTRQATNKPLNDFRDTFSGIKSLTMRDEETRKRCRRAQS